MEWLMANWVTLLAAIFAFGLVVFVHESGHFFIARRAGVRVHEFSLGFGPQVWRHMAGETEYSIRAVPLGGFVRLEGEDAPDANPDDPGNFQNKTTWQKFSVIVGGCMMNYVSAFLVFTTVGLCHGLPSFTPSDDLGTTVGSVPSDMPAAAAGVQKGDKVTAVDGQPVTTWKEMTSKISSQPGKPVHVTLDRAGQVLNVIITPKPTEDKDEAGHPIVKGRIGIGSDQPTVTLSFTPSTGGFPEVAAAYWSMAYKLTMAPIDLVSDIVKGKKKVSEAKEEAGGPLFIGNQLMYAASKGPWHLMFLWSVISTLVGGFNLLPVPALDGMRAFLLLVGAIRRKPIDQNKEALVHTVGLAVLLTLVVFITFQDIGKLRSGVQLFH